MPVRLAATWSCASGISLLAAEGQGNVASEELQLGAASLFVSCDVPTSEYSGRRS